MIRVLAIIWLIFAAPLAGAAPKISESVKYYAVTGSTLGELRRDMARRAPNGFWGFTRWWITWTRNCAVNLEITITMPRLDPVAQLSAQDRRIWDAMIDALYRHEQLHAEHGRRAAAEIHQTNCSNPRRVIRNWAQRDRILDRETRHGATQGVALPD